MSWRTVFEYALGGIISTIFLWFIPNLWNKYKYEIALKAKLNQKLTPREISKIIKNFDRKYDEEDVMIQIMKGLENNEFAKSKIRLNEQQVTIKESLAHYSEHISIDSKNNDYSKDYFEKIELEANDIWKWFQNFRMGKYNDKTQIYLFKHQLNDLERSFFLIITAIKKLFRLLQ